MTSADVLEDEAIDPRLDETTALLVAPAKASPARDDESGPNDNGTEDDNPSPRVQFLFLCFARVVEPIAFFCIFPFINQMIRDTGVAEEDVGFYSGLIV